MTSSLFIQSGARVRLPSGVCAVFVRWQARHINPENRVEGMERVAVVQIEGGIGVSEFAERFMQHCKVVA